MNTIFTLPGKLGDNLCKLPIAHQYSLQNNCKVDLCLDNASYKLLPLLQSQSWVNTAFCIDGITEYFCGGQPYHFNQEQYFTSNWTNVYHLGYKTFPDNNLTLSSLSDVPIDSINLLSQNCIDQVEYKNPDGIILEAQSSRPYANEEVIRCADIVMSNLNTKLYISLFEEDESKYQCLLKYNPQFILSTSFTDMVETLKDKVLLTTYSAISCLAYICKYPQVIYYEQSTSLNHFDFGLSWYDRQHCIRSDSRLVQEKLGELLQYGL